MFLVLDVFCLIVYNRQTLLEIGSTVTHRKPEFKFLNTVPLFTNNSAEPFVWATRRRRRKQNRRRGKRAGVLVRLRCWADRRPLSSILLGNVQSLDNKLCEPRARISFQCEIRDRSIICLTETWMSRKVPDFAIEPTGFSVHRANRIPDLSGKSKGGGVCFMINNYWCDRKNAECLYNLFVLLTWNTSCFSASRFGYRGNSQRSSLQLFTSPLKPTQMQHSRNSMGIYANRWPCTLTLCLLGFQQSQS